MVILKISGYESILLLKYHHYGKIRFCRRWRDDQWLTIAVCIAVTVLRSQMCLLTEYQHLLPTSCSINDIRTSQIYVVNPQKLNYQAKSKEVKASSTFTSSKCKTLFMNSWISINNLIPFCSCYGRCSGWWLSLLATGFDLWAGGLSGWSLHVLPLCVCVLSRFSSFFPQSKDKRNLNFICKQLKFTKVLQLSKTWTNICRM